MQSEISNFKKELPALMKPINYLQNLDCIYKAEKPTVACRPIYFLKFWLPAEEESHKCYIYKKIYRRNYKL